VPRPLAPAWLDYRNRLAATAVAAVGIVLWIGGLGAALRVLLDDGAALHALEAAWLTGAIASLGWLAAFRCPSCGHPFHWTLWWANPVADECLHCGFRKWRDPRPVREIPPR
jgi:Zn ribbon nucleic-acid-binding protein